MLRVADRKKNKTNPANRDFTLCKLHPQLANKSKNSKLTYNVCQNLERNFFSKSQVGEEGIF